MAIDWVQDQDHDSLLLRIQDAISADLWEERITAIELVQRLLRDLPQEGVVDRLIDVLDHLSRDSKWEIRRATVAALLAVSRPEAGGLIERLAADANRWVRQAAERAQRRAKRVTGPAEKDDPHARFAFETIQKLDGSSRERIYAAALLVGEKHYEELAGDTAHELNTYRTSMAGLLDELEHRVANSEVASNEVQEILDLIRSRSGYLRCLVEGLLDYSRDADLQYEVHYVREIVQEALELARGKARAILAVRDVEELVEIEEGLTLEASGDRLLQALVNILSNAIESFDGSDPGDERIEIRASLGEEGAVTIAVTDTGVGMDPSQVADATKRFRSLKKESGGIGLGLPLAVKIVEREHGGKVDIKSALGAGTTVLIEVPASQREL